MSYCPSSALKRKALNWMLECMESLIDRGDRGPQAIEEKRVDLLEKVKTLIPILRDACNTIEGRGERITYVRIANIFNLQKLPCLYGESWNRLAIHKLVSIDGQLARLAKLVLIAEGRARTHRINCLFIVGDHAAETENWVKVHAARNMAVTEAIEAASEVRHIIGLYTDGNIIESC